MMVPVGLEYDTSEDCTSGGKESCTTGEDRLVRHSRYCSFRPLAESVVPAKAGSSGMISARWVGWRHRLVAKEVKALRCPRRAAVMRIRLFLAWLSASCRALKSPADPLMAVETNRSFPRILWNFLWETRLVLARSVKIWASSSLRWDGSLIVCQTVSMIQPSATLRVDQLPSPFRSFLRDTASFRLSARLRLGKNVVNGCQWVVAECVHALGASLPDLDEIVHKNVGVTEWAFVWAIGRWCPFMWGPCLEGPS